MSAGCDASVSCTVQYAECAPCILCASGVLRVDGFLQLCHVCSRCYWRCGLLCMPAVLLVFMCEMGDSVADVLKRKLQL